MVKPGVTALPLTYTESGDDAALLVNTIADELVTVAVGV